MPNEETEVPEAQLFGTRHRTTSSARGPLNTHYSEKQSRMIHAEQPHRSRSAGFYASSADCSHQPWVMKLHFASMLPPAAPGSRQASDGGSAQAALHLWMQSC